MATCNGNWCALPSKEKTQKERKKEKKETSKQSLSIDCNKRRNFDTLSQQQQKRYQNKTIKHEAWVRVYLHLKC